MGYIPLDEKSIPSVTADILSVSDLYTSAHRQNTDIPALNLQESYINYSKCYFLIIENGEYTKLLHFEFGLSAADTLRGDIYYKSDDKPARYYTILRRKGTDYYLCGALDGHGVAVIESFRKVRDGFLPFSAGARHKRPIIAFIAVSLIVSAAWYALNYRTELHNEVISETEGEETDTSQNSPVSFSIVSYTPNVKKGEKGVLEIKADNGTDYAISFVNSYGDECEILAEISLDGYGGIKWSWDSGEMDSGIYYITVSEEKSDCRTIKFEVTD